MPRTKAHDAQAEAGDSRHGNVPTHQWSPLEDGDGVAGDAYPPRGVPVHGALSYSLLRRCCDAYVPSTEDMVRFRIVTWAS